MQDNLGEVQSLPNYQNFALDIAPPAVGKAVELVAGIWWLRLPLQSALGYVNVYAIDDTNGWCLIDTGENTDACRSALQKIFFDNGPLSHRPVTRVIATHYHPDHIGLAGWFAQRGAELYATRLCWLYARMLQLDDREVPCDEQIRFAVRAGVNGLALAAYQRRRPSSFPQLVAPVPFAYHRLEAGDRLTIGQRQWQVHISHGHAAGHATIWSDDGLVFTGDQILPGICSNLSVHASEPDADLVSEWLESCRQLKSISNNRELCFPGHNQPFVGAATRCEQLIHSVEAALGRLRQRLVRPATAVECLDAIYGRPLNSHEQATLIAEAVGFLNHLKKQHQVEASVARDGSYIWRQVRTPVPQR